MTRFALIASVAVCLPGCDGAGLIQLIFLPLQIASAVSQSQHAREWHWSQGDRRCRASRGTDCSRGGVRLRPEYIPEPEPLPPSRSERIRDGGAMAMGCDNAIITERYENERYAFSGCTRRAVLDCDELRGGHFFCQEHRASAASGPQPVANVAVTTLRPIAIEAPTAMLVAGASPRQSATGPQYCQYTYPTVDRHCYASQSECQLSTYTSEPDEARRRAACHLLATAWCVGSGVGDDCFAMESACESRAAALDPSNPPRCFVRR